MRCAAPHIEVDAARREDANVPEAVVSNSGRQRHAAGSAPMFAGPSVARAVRGTQSTSTDGLRFGGSAMGSGLDLPSLLPSHWAAARAAAQATPT
jgi:CubicO group peptidase (beta-lactamase class C family)